MATTTCWVRCICVPVPLLCMSWFILQPLGRCWSFLGSNGKYIVASAENSSAENANWDSATGWLATCCCRGEDIDRKHDRTHLPTSDQSRASHSGGQLWLLQGSVRDGRRGVHAESSRTFSSVPDIRLLHNTCRVRRPPLQLRLHSDHSPVHQLEAEKSVLYFLICTE